MDYYIDAVGKFFEYETFKILKFVDSSSNPILVRNLTIEKYDFLKRKLKLKSDSNVDLIFRNKYGDYKTLEVKSSLKYLSDFKIHYLKSYFSEYWIFFSINPYNIEKSKYQILKYYDVKELKNYCKPQKKYNLKHLNLNSFLSFDKFIIKLIDVLNLNSQDFNYKIDFVNSDLRQFIETLNI